MPLRPPDARLFQSLYALGLGPLVGRAVLLLTTTGRRSGLARTTPLQYEQVGPDLLVASSRGTRADWYRNLLADPRVTVRWKAGQARAAAEPVSDPQRIADFLELRLRRHPRMVGAILRSEGLPANPSREQLVDYAGRLALVILHLDPPARPLA